MKKQLTSDQIEVLDEFIAEVRNDSAIKTANMFSKRLLYDINTSEGEAIELLNEHFYDLIPEKNLSNLQIIRLAKKIRVREHKWIFMESIDTLDWDDVTYDGMVYVYISDGTRIDFSPDQYKNEREAFNKQRDERLKKQPTNGKEYLLK